MLKSNIQPYHIVQYAMVYGPGTCSISIIHTDNEQDDLVFSIKEMYVSTFIYYFFLFLSLSLINSSFSHFRLRENDVNQVYLTVTFKHPAYCRVWNVWIEEIPNHVFLFNKILLLLLFRLWTAQNWHLSGCVVDWQIIKVNSPKYLQFQIIQMENISIFSCTFRTWDSVLSRLMPDCSVYGFHQFPFEYLWNFCECTYFVTWLIDGAITVQHCALCIVHIVFRLPPLHSFAYKYEFI